MKRNPNRPINRNDFYDINSFIWMRLLMSVEMIIYLHFNIRQQMEMEMGMIKINKLARISHII